MENKNLVVAIVVVFVLIIVFAGFLFFRGSGEFKTPSVSSTVSSLVTTCDEWCAAEDFNGWCDFELSASETVSGTCYAFSKSTIYAEYGVKACPAIDCDNRPEVQTEFTCEELGGVWEASVGGICDQVGVIERFVQDGPTDAPPTAGQICCTNPEF
ncbi:MAG: hypothetical protein KKB29_02455 [Nanoarchaeota archaeon]|nr:hypothetical protein [Nanoarchaeota archaeon]